VARDIDQWLQHPALKERAGPMGAVALALGALRR
jgi:hypothetical protein